MTTTWDASTISFSISLSNGGMTASSTDSTSSGQGYSVNTGWQGTGDGKRVAIMRIDTVAGTYSFVGWGTGGSTYTNEVMGSYRNDSVAWFQDGSIFFNNSVVATVATFTTGDILYLASNRVKASNLMNCWFGKMVSGSIVWNNDPLADPATGVGGINVGTWQSFGINPNEINLGCGFVDGSPLGVTTLDPYGSLAEVGFSLPSGFSWYDTIPALQTLTLSSSSAFANAHNGEFVGAIQNTTSGSSLAITGGTGSSYFSISGGNVVATGNIPTGTYDIDITETLSGATGSPKTTNLSITVSASPAMRLVAVATGTNTITMPTHVAGDRFVGYGFRDGNTTAPSLPTGWTNIQNPAGANTCSQRLATLLATGSAHSAPVFTNATSVEVEQWRPGSGAITIGGSAVSAGSTNTLTFPAVTLTKTDNTSRVLGFAGHRSTNQNLETPPTGMTNIVNVQDATDEATGHVTTSTVTSFTSRTVTLTGTASGWQSVCCELVFTASGGTTYNQSCLTNTSPAPTDRVTVGKLLRVTSSAMSSLARAMAKRGQAITTPAPAASRSTTRSANVDTTPAPSRAHQVGKLFFGSVTALPSLTSSKARQQAAQVDTTPPPALRRDMAKSLQVVTTLLSSLSRLLSKAFSVSTTPTPSRSALTSRGLYVVTTPTPVLTRQSSRSLLASTSPLGRLMRAVAKALQVSTAPISVVTRSTPKGLLTITTPAPSENHGLAFLKALFVSSAPAPAAARQSSRTAQATTSPASRLMRAVAKLLLGSTSPGGAVMRASAKGLTTSTTPAPAENHGLAFLKGIFTSSTPVPRATKQAGRSAQVTTAPLPRLVRAISKLLLGATTPQAVVTRSSARSYQTASTPVPTVAQVKARVMSVQTVTAPLSAARRAIGKLVQIPTTPAPTLRRLVARSLLVAATAAASCSKMVSRFAQGSSSPAPSTAQRLALSVQIQALTAPTGRLARSIGKVLAAYTAAAALLTTARTLNLRLQAAADVEGALRRSTTRFLRTTTSPLADLVAILNPIVIRARVRIFTILFHRKRS